MAAPPYPRVLATESLVDGQQGIMSQFRQNETSVEFFFPANWKKARNSILYFSKSFLIPIFRILLISQFTSVF